MSAASKTKRYCVIGAGFGGLGVAKAFVDYGIEFDCFDKNEDLGGNWLNGVYDSTHIISSRDTTAYGDFKMPDGYPDFPSRDQILSYLRAYADHFKLRGHIRFGVSVEEVTPLDPRGMTGWRVKLSTGETRHYQGVVIANGHHWDKRIPNYPGSFAGRMLHSKDYKNAKDFAKDSERGRVLVVGAGNSGCDIAVEAAANGHESWMSIRRGYYFLPKTVFGVPVAELDRPGFPVFAQKLFLKAALKIILGSNERYGIPKPDHDLFEHHPIVNSQLMYHIRQGEVRMKADIARLDGKTIHFKDGSKLDDVDTIIWATGYNVSFPFLDRELFRWENGIPRRVAGMMPEGVAGLYVFGLAQPRGGAGPLITEATKFLSELVLAQEKMNHPISIDFSRFKKPSAKMLVGVTQSMREIRIGRFLIKRFSKRRSKKTDLRLMKERPILPRNVKFDREADIPRYWFFDSAFGTHMANGLNLLFPEGERYFIRSVNAFMSEIDDPALRSRAKAFSGQETRHGREHERYFEILAKQGFDVRSVLSAYEKTAFGVLEKIYPKKLNLAMTAAFEHYTATFAERCLKDRYFPDHAHAAMSELFMWHAVEEIEHKSVAYDVLQAVAPSYPLRIAGLMLATLHLAVFWQMATFSLLRQDSDVKASQLTRELVAAIRDRRFLNGDYLRAFLQYSRPSFHPSQIDNEELAAEALRYLSKQKKSGVDFGINDQAPVALGL